jgi:Na+-transporting methylmalonyl-CoA/oxaloacetate decarboxylase gamma subunit
MKRLADILRAVWLFLRWSPIIALFLVMSALVMAAELIEALFRRPAPVPVPEDETLCTICGRPIQACKQVTRESLQEVEKTARS